MGEDISREELLSGLENRCIRQEVRTRETGHMWKEYTLLERIPSKEEYDYTDTWRFYPVRLTCFLT